MSVASVLTRNDGNAPPANGRVRQWLSRAGLGEYRDAFARTAEREFTALGMVDFQNFGVVDVAHKQTLFRLIKNLQNAESDLQNDLQKDLQILLEKLRILDVFYAAIRIHMNSACSVIIWRFIGPELTAFEGAFALHAFAPSASFQASREGED